ncbi:NEL-type E3 ubiquitin ligase domain-containing protein [Pseudomonas fragi]|uniref:NEL-type E3 ubiquitin ligase domain-containing protein n=1 Tax=Pseudomonas fragi TaxID=296 RepID=UPI002D77E80D|nr:NEL-type E3 ubiquitin ligase domain-containing protein [Pseudomonas fragi]WRT62842.1 NEL-type E3 ubiquitin ligase domain-containing protein [Pseudomonas fragi]
MTDTFASVISTAEQTVIEQAARLAKTPAENRHVAYLPELMPPWFVQAPPALREALRSSFRQWQATRRATSAILAQVQPIEEFAEPLLRAALTARGWGEVDPRSYGIKQVRLLSNLVLFFARQQVKLVDTVIQLAWPELLTPESLELDLVSGITRHSLLQAALQNFERAETAEDGFDPGSCLYQVSGEADVQHATFKPWAFAAICRDLYLGTQYQWHLSRVFEPIDDNLAPEDSNSRAYKVNVAFSQNKRYEFTSALHMAMMKMEISPANYAFLINLLAAPGAISSRVPVVHSTLLERQACFLNLGLSLLTIALGFVPVLGEVLLVTSVIQLGVDVYEGISAWQQGDRVAALEYLFDVAQNIALTAGPATLRPAPLVDALVPVRLVTGQRRLWRPDLTPYAMPKNSLAGLLPDAQGLYSVGERQFIRLEDKVYGVKVDPQTLKGHIQHPHDPQAYTPRIEHNGSGAWVHELEDPMHWSSSQLLRRLGPEARGVGDASARQALAVSNTEEGMLRKLYLEHLPLPALLSDSLSRIRLSEMIESFIVQMQQGGNRWADNPEMQLDLITRLPGWPPDRVLRVVDIQGTTLREYGPDLAPAHPRLQIVESQIRNGDLLKVTLECLSTAQVEALLGQAIEGLQQQLQALARQLGEQAAATRGELLARLYDAQDAVPEQAQALKNQFPGLPGVVLQELLHHLSAARLGVDDSAGRLPLHVLEDARSYTRALRLNRALEGLGFDALSNADSLRLAWKTLPEVPGWPASLRLVIRDKASGTVLDSVGSDSALYSHELFKSADGYEFHGTASQDVYRSPDLLECVLQSLTPAQRQSLGLPLAEPLAALRARIAARAASYRENSAVALGMQPVKPWFKSPLRLADGRLGYTLGGRSGHMLETERTHLLKDLVSELFPLMDETQAGQFLYRLKLTPELTTRALARLKGELQTLRNDLEQWEKATVWTQPAEGPRVPVPVPVKRAMSQALIRTWRRQTETLSLGDYTGHVLDLNAWPVDCLPELSADFGHVGTLRLHNSPNGRFANRFLERCPNVRVLSLVNCQLLELPTAISGMHELIDLDLHGNRIELNDRSTSILAGLNKLQSLNLVGNTLGRRISVRRMTGLVHLRLRYTGLQTWPEGVEALTGLQTLDLRDNAITRIPQEVLTAQRAALNRVTHLHDNPLSADSLRRLESYRRSQGIDFGIMPGRQHVMPVRGIFHWASQPTFQQNDIWHDLSSLERSADFFRVIEDLSASSQYLHGRESLSRRVWAMLNAMHAHGELRDELFEVSANPNTCADGIPMIFADLELRHQIFIAQSTVNTESKLLTLGQGLFRLELLDKHVRSVIEGRVAQVHAEQSEYVRQLQTLVDAVSADFASGPVADMTPLEQQGVAYRLGTRQAMRLAQRLSPADLQARIERIDPLEVQMFYQVNLARQLGLPARPTSMIFERMANVTPQQLEIARLHVVSEDTLETRTAYIEKQGFWAGFLEKKYPEAFSAADAPLHERMQVIYIAREGMSSQDYVAQTQAVGQSRQQVREALIARLTRAEIEKYPFSEPGA